MKSADASAAEDISEKSCFTFGGGELKVRDIFAVAVEAARKGVPAPTDRIPVFGGKCYIVEQLCGNSGVSAIYFTCEPVKLFFCGDLVHAADVHRLGAFAFLPNSRLLRGFYNLGGGFHIACRILTAHSYGENLAFIRG